MRTTWWRLAGLLVCGAIGLAACGTTSASSQVKSATITPAALLERLRIQLHPLVHQYFAAAQAHHIPSSVIGATTKQFVPEMSRVVTIKGHWYVGVAFPYAPDGTPVRVYEYSNRRRWVQVSALISPFTESATDPMVGLFGSSMPTLHLDGLSAPAFEVKMFGGGCFPGAVLAETTSHWHYLKAPNAANQPAIEIGGDPHVVHGHLVTTSDCSANPTYSGSTETIWRLDVARGAFVPLRTKTLS
jgi:hypothetical protein